MEYAVNLMVKRLRAGCDAAELLELKEWLIQIFNYETIQAIQLQNG